MGIASLKDSFKISNLSRAYSGIAPFNDSIDFRMIRVQDLAGRKKAEVKRPHKGTVRPSNLTTLDSRIAH